VEPAHVPIVSYLEEMQMQRFVDVARSFAAEEDGLAVTEYGLLLALVAVALVAVVKTFGSTIKTWFGKATTDVTTAAPQ
jgi:Flp pilus assembly pilin Flp